MNFPSIDIQGSILSSELLSKIRNEQATFQTGKDFYPLIKNFNLKDEISLAWQDAKGQWAIFKSKLSRLKEGESGTTETRNFWIVPLLTNLGFNLNFIKQAEELNGKSFSIGFRDTDLGGFPIYVGGFNESLDKRPENKLLRVSPHAMVQEYLNYSEHLYGMVTNGRQLRLLRDASRITRLSYVEFNLEKMMEEDLYSDFSLLYRVLHASRMPKSMDAGADSIIEKYHQESLEAGSTIRSKLGNAVKTAITDLANGFVNHPKNTQLRDAIANGNFNADEYYRQQLRIIYRLLFLFVIEERNLVYGESKTLETKRFNEIYFNHYSLLRLRKLAKKLLPPEADRHYDLWQGLVSTFSLFEKKEIGEKMGIMALQGDLFGYNAINGNGADLHRCYLSNKVLLNIIKSLSYFENENGVLIAVNYGGLDVEEFGSVYEGLLELKLQYTKPIANSATDEYRFTFDSSTERGKTGSHYTPEELVQPLIKHSLEYLIEDRVKPYYQKKADKPATLKALLSLKIADIACGSGHILLSAARRLALEIARVQTDEEQPNPLAIRKAMKEVVRNCIYGVDKNPLAIELCKIALWLEAFNPGEPLNFLDHHIKCGDAIVGLAHRSELERGIPDEAFKTLPDDNKVVAAAFRKRNQEERKLQGQIAFDFEAPISEEVNAVIEKFNLFKNLPENTPDEVTKKETAYKNFEKSVERIRLKQLADAQVAQFFIPKTETTKAYLLTDTEYRGLLRNVHKGLGPIISQKLSYVETIVPQYRFFHWFIEFPEVFNEGGFDCILGNPPYLGARLLSGTFGSYFANNLNAYFHPAVGRVDLVSYFFRRSFSIIKENNFLAFISTNTISQGDTRMSGLFEILKNGGKINFANRNVKWPGKAAVDVSLLTILKGTRKISFFLDNQKVDIITSFLDSEAQIHEPKLLKINSNRSFQGSVILGEGFYLNESRAFEIFQENTIYKQVIQKKLGGYDFLSNPEQLSKEWIINLFDMSLNEATSKYPICVEIVKNLVKPERDLVKRKVYREIWWQYAEKGINLYKAIAKLNRVLVGPLVSKYFSIGFVPNEYVFLNKLVVFPFNRSLYFTYLQSTIHEIWSWKYSTTIGSSGINYSPPRCFETFPLPQNINKNLEQIIEAIGEAYHEYRSQLMIGIQLGLTKTYNLFHCPAISVQAINETDKQVASLINHLQKTPNTLPFSEAIAGIIHLRELHVQMDCAVLEAYGWSDIDLAHDFYEQDYLPENDRIRYTISPEARKEVLSRLLALNHKLHAEEVAAGLWDKKKASSKSTKTTKQNSSPGLFNQE